MAQATRAPSGMHRITHEICGNDEEYVLNSMFADYINHLSCVHVRKRSHSIMFHGKLHGIFGIRIHYTNSIRCGAFMRCAACLQSKRGCAALNVCRECLSGLWCTMEAGKGRGGGA